VQLATTHPKKGLLLLHSHIVLPEPISVFPAISMMDVVSMRMTMMSPYATWAIASVVIKILIAMFREILTQIKV
jgi:hypothetical protein